MNKRLLFLTPGLAKGGAETQLLKVAEFCQNQGIEVMIIALKPLNNLGDTVKASGIQIVFLEDWRRNGISNLILLYRTIRAFNPQVVIAFMFVAILFARLLKLAFTFKLISSIRNSIISPKWMQVFKATSNLDDLVVYNATASKNNFEENALAKKGGIVINNAITVPSLESHIMECDEYFTWISMAHFRPSKDYETLFNAIPLIKYKKFRLIIIGHLNGLTWPHERIKELNIEDKVRILGFRNNSHDYLKGADALVLSSFNEGMPNAILEAMAYSKPIVASEIDGIRELLTDCDCGFLVEKGNPGDLAEKMNKIMEMSVEQRNKLSSQGRNHIEEYFSEEVVLNKWLQVILPFFNKKQERVMIFSENNA